MTSALPTPTRRPRHENAAQWHRSLGDVPLERVIFDPLPGTATETDLLYLGERDKLCELIDGTLVQKTAGFWESLIAANLVSLLVEHVRPTNLGVITGPDCPMRMNSSGHIRLPDVSFISMRRLPQSRDPIPTLAPDLAGEVLSKGNTAREIDLKLCEYFGSGTRLAWIIDPEARTVAVYHAADNVTSVLQESDLLDGEHVLPGFSAPVAELFGNVPRS